MLEFTPAKRVRRSKDEQYSLSHFAEKHRIPLQKARHILEQAGKDRDQANKLAKAFKVSQRGF